MFDVEYSTDGTTWINLESFNQNTLTTSFSKRTLDLSSLSGSTVQLAFHAWENYYANGVYLDDVNLISSSTPSWAYIVGGSPHTGSIAPGGPQQNVTIQLDAGGLPDGTYTTDIIVESNDPFEQYVAIPLTLHVQTPGISVSNSYLFFGYVVLGNSSTRQFSIENPGNSYLVGTLSAPSQYEVALAGRDQVTRDSNRQRVESARIEPFESFSDFSDGSQTRNSILFSVPAGGSRTYDIIYTPDVIGDHEDILTIAHNAPGEDKTISLWSTVITQPTVLTGNVTSIQPYSAIVSGQVTATGGISVSSRGICWDTQVMPTTDDPHNQEGSGLGTFSSTLNNLIPNTHYYARAYAVNAAGTSYGIQVDFTTLSLGPPETPENVVISVTDSGVLLSWSEVTDADEYAIYRSDDPSAINWGTAIGTTSGTSWLDMEPLRNGKAFYFITAVRSVRIERSDDSVRLRE